MLSENRAQGRLRKHVGGGEVILNLDDGPFGIDHVEVEYRVNLHRDVVVRDHVLGRYLNDLDAQIHSHHFLDEGDQQHKAGSFDPLKTPQSEDHCPLIFPQDLHARRDQNERHNQDDRGDIAEEGNQDVALFLSQRS